MSDQITSVVQACNIRSRNLWFIASKLTYDLKIQLVHALVLSRLDYCNNLYHDISSKDLGTEAARGEANCHHMGVHYEVIFAI